MTEISQGVLGDGAAILKDGQPITIEQIIDDLTRFALIKEVLAAKESGFIPGDATEILSAIAFDWDIDKIRAGLIHDGKFEKPA